MRTSKSTLAVIWWLTISASPAGAAIVYDQANSSTSLSAQAGTSNPSVFCGSTDMLVTSGGSGSVSITNQPCTCSPFGSVCSLSSFTLDPYTAEGTYTSSSDGSGHFTFTDVTDPNGYNAGCYGGDGGVFATTTASADVQFSVVDADTAVHFHFSLSGTGSGNGSSFWYARIDNDPASWDWQGGRCYSDGCADDPLPTLDETVSLSPGIHLLHVYSSIGTGGQCPLIPSGTLSGAFSFAISAAGPLTTPTPTPTATPDDRRCGVRIFSVRWSPNSCAGPTRARFNLDIDIVFATTPPFDPACCEYRQQAASEWEVLAGPHKGKQLATPLTYEKYDRQSDLDGNKDPADPVFETNDRPGLGGSTPCSPAAAGYWDLTADDNIDYSFTAVQSVIDICHGGEPVATRGPHIVTIRGAYPRRVTGIPKVIDK